MTTTAPATTSAPDAWLEAIFAMIDNPEAATAAPVPTVPKVAAKVAKPCACPKCGGSGKLYEFRHVSGGVCFRCNGARFILA